MLPPNFGSPGHECWSGSMLLCQSNLSQRPLYTHYCHLSSSASAVCSDWHSTGSTSRTATGQQSVAVYAPASWNRLPLALLSPDLSASSFKRALKMHLFLTAWHHWDVFVFCHCVVAYKYPDLRTWLMAMLPPSAWPHWLCWMCLQRNCFCSVQNKLN